MTNTTAPATLKITVRFDGIADEETATAVQHQIECGEMTVADLYPLDDTAAALLSTAIEELAERGDPTPAWCELTVTADGNQGVGSSAVEGHLIDSNTGEPVRPATTAEIIDSLRSGPEGHILVDGRKVFVA